MSRKSYKSDESTTSEKKDYGKRGSKGRSKNKGRVDRTSAGLDGRGRDNDPNFYFSSPELAQQAAELSFQSVLGQGAIDSYKVPSICRVRLNPSPGISYQQLTFIGDPGMEEDGTVNSLDGNKHGINLMSSKLYTMLSTFTGRTSQYAPQDVAMMILAISSIAELAEHIRRVFGIALTYNPRNRDLPLGLIRSMGIDVADFMARIPEYRMRFNVNMTRINQIPLLDNIAYIKKSREIYQRVYMDSLSPMAQLFYYCPHSVWMLNETDDPNGSYLATTVITLNLGKRKLEALLDLLETCITRLLESSTLNLIYADLLNMANKIKVPVWQFDYLAENYIVMPEYNRNAVMQFHHLRAVGDPYAIEAGIRTPLQRFKWNTSDPSFLTPEMVITGSNHVVSDPNTNNVIYNPAFKDRSYTKTLVDMDTNNPSIEDKIEALRFSVTSSGSKILLSEIQNNVSPTAHAAILPSLPDHYCVDFQVHENIDFNAANLPNRCVIESTIIKGTSIPIGHVADIGKITKAPLLYCCDSGAAHNTVEEILGDLDFYTQVDYSYLSRVNEIMYTGLFDFRV